jgi:hypothetical protein
MQAVTMGADMKIKLKPILKPLHIMNVARLTFYILLTTLSLTVGCAGFVHHSDPLVGFHFSSLNNLDSNKAITDDYKDYIQKLSPEERERVGLKYFEDGTGQHAVRITIGLNGTVWRHVLIYDKYDKRIKTIKYASGDYAS